MTTFRSWCNNLTFIIYHAKFEETLADPKLQVENILNHKQANENPQTNNAMQHVQCKTKVQIKDFAETQIEEHFLQRFEREDISGFSKEEDCIPFHVMETWCIVKTHHPPFVHGFNKNWAIFSSTIFEAPKKLIAEK